MLEQRKYDNVDSHSTSDGAAALNRLNECFPNSQDLSGRSDKAFRELKRDLAEDKITGDHLDHIVPQAQTDRFGTQVIQHPGNVVWEPADVHMARTAIGNRSLPPNSEGAKQGFQLTREYTGSLSHSEQMQVGIREIRDAMDKKGVAPEVRAHMEKQLQSIERQMPEICAPKIEKALPSLNELQNVIELQNQTSDRSLPDVRSVADWNGKTGYGTMLDLGDGQVAQHQGQGTYAVVDIQRDLNGQTPPFGQYAMLQANGQVQVPSQTMSLGMQLG